MGNTPMSISTFDHGVNPTIRRGTLSRNARFVQIIPNRMLIDFGMKLVSLGASGKLEYVGPANGSERMGGVGIVFVKDANSE